MATQAREAVKVSVVRMNLGLIFHSYRRNMRVGHQICADTSSHQILAEKVQVIGSGIDWHYVGVLEPFKNKINRFSRMRRMNQDSGVGHQPHEAGRHNPGDAYSFRAVDQIFPPASGEAVKGCAITMRINQQVQIRNYQDASGSAKDSASNWSLV